MDPLDHAAFLAQSEGRAHTPVTAPKRGCPWGAVAGRLAGVLSLATLALLALFWWEGWAWAGIVGTLAGATAFCAGTVWATHAACRARWGDPALLSAIVQASRASRMITDTEGQTAYASAGLPALLGTPAPPGDVGALARAFAEPESARFLFQRMLQEAAHGMPGESVTLPLLVPDTSEEKWIRVATHPLHGQEGLVCWHIEDITEDHILARTAEAERAGLVDFADNAPVGFFSLDEEGRFLFANATLARWLGEDLATLTAGARLHTYMVTPPGPGAAPYDLAECEGSRQALETRLKGPGGQTFLASVTQALVRDDVAGRVVTRGVVYDLTGERGLKKALADSEDRFHHFFDNAPVGIALVGEDGTIGDCNEAFAAMLRLGIAEANGQNIEALLAAGDRDRTLSALAAVAAGRVKEAVEEVTLEGRVGPVMTRLHARQFQNDGKGDVRLALHCVDMTQHRQLEAQVAQSQKMQAVGQLAGGMAHDFNNLLTAMIGFCDLLLLRHRPGDPSFADIMQIKQNANRASNLVRQILAFSRQQTLRPRVLDLTEVLTELSHLLRRLLGPGIKLAITHGQDLARVRVDEVQMEQVLINLAVNARDAMGEAGTLTIATENYTNTAPQILGAAQETLPPGDWVAISVEDTGCGIDSETLTRIFEPFFTTKPQGKGTGLGLATVYGIIRQTGGYLDVRSAVGAGTRFRIFLPQTKGDTQAASAGAPEAESESRQDLTGSAYLLLVEDEEAVRVFSKRALEGKGYTVLSAPSGPETVALLDDPSACAEAGVGSRAPDLLITDVVMPEMDGPTLAQALRARWPALKIIFISGYTEDRLAEHMGERVWFLPKPFTLRQLAAKVKAVLQEG
ncbi:MAG: PAS domain-containing protein [Alphaproteobacteria bacterium]|nr:PAS domain-containing protein [Alphaproteobacteria bacterium]